MIKARLSDLADDVLGGRVHRSDAAVVGQVLNVLLRAIEVERKLKETEQLEAELADLRSTLEEVRREKSNSWVG